MLGCTHSMLLLQALPTTSACDGGPLQRQPPWDKQSLQTISQLIRLPLPQVSYVTELAAPQLSVLPGEASLLSVNGVLRCQCLAAWNPSFKEVHLGYAMVAGAVVAHYPLG